MEEAKLILWERARLGRPISYSELAGQIRTINFQANDKPFHDLLGYLSVREHSEGRGLLSVLVVHKGGDLRPGKGFFQLAKECGLTGDEEKIWSDQFSKVTTMHQS